ncbi:ParB N-terminal domain-containing protein [Novosphingobium flavum]|uniref:site-specific DNA-methyltransferase (adenine-specific) n=1 Tax=Novosphingobium flavum TaxID=1778672 RepID=A0A7X1FTN2_9SPHN|nr:DNA methyltransferase [Novosphingobium flavum]MBC2666758.1 ParB N-terminal domain-containing protein [Novosphingobium flavum]
MQTPQIRRRERISPAAITPAATSAQPDNKPHSETRPSLAPVRTRWRPGSAVSPPITDAVPSPADEPVIVVQVPAPTCRPRRERYTATPVVPAGSEVLPLTNRPDESLAVEVTYRTIEEVKPPRRQLRTHSPKQVEQIISSIRRLGFINPIIVDAEGTIICGVGRYLAAREMGLSRLPTIMVDHLSEAERRAYAIADNKLVLNDTWDEKLLAVEIRELMVEDIDLPIELTQFDMIEIDALLHEKAQNDDAPPEPDDGPPISRLGDLFDLGGHRLLCGDSREEESYQILLGEERARCVYSDNPYNIKILGNVSGLGKVKHSDFVMASGEMSREEFTAFLTSVFTLCARYSVDGAIQFQWMDHRHMREMLDAGDAAYGELKTLVVWDKQVPGMGSFYRNQFELVFVYKVGKAPHRNNFGLGQWGRNRSSIWSYPGANAMRRGRLNDLALHPTVKNLPMTIDAIRDVTHRGEIVLDPFSGAATTILACEKSGRIGRAIELDPKYVDVGIMRWQKATGKQAVHVATGLTFTELALARMAGSDEDGGDLPDEKDKEASGDDDAVSLDDPDDEDPDE